MAPRQSEIDPDPALGTPAGWRVLLALHFEERIDLYLGDGGALQIMGRSPTWPPAASTASPATSPPAKSTTPALKRIRFALTRSDEAVAIGTRAMAPVVGRCSPKPLG